MRCVSTKLRFNLLALIFFCLPIGKLVHAQTLPGVELAPALIETVNPLVDIVLPRLYPVIVADVSPSLGDATLINRINFVVSLGMMDAAAPYHPRAVGMYSRIPRRPEAEAIGRNINTAMLHAAYRTLLGLLPDREPVWREMLSDYGLNPDDASSDLTRPVGIGNIAGRSALEGRLYDGMNQTGDYQDTTGYAPVNSAYQLRDPARWQPGLRLQGIGIYTAQQFVTPQLANTEPVAVFDPRAFRVPPPTASDVDDWDAYKGQVDDVLAVSAALTDEQKMMAELFDNKIVSLGLSYLHLAQELDLSPADTVRGYFVKVAAALDSSIVIWQEKARFDAVRPFSAIRHVYGDAPVTTSGGLGEGAGEIPANQWLSYLPEADHPEYPSGSTCGCFAQAQALRRFTGADDLHWSVAYPAGSSRIEPGVTPARDMSLQFATLTDFAENCGAARVWGGVHFPAAVEASAALCSDFGDMAFEYYSTLMDGAAAERQPAQALQPDPWLAPAPTAQAIVVPEPTTPTPEACEAVSDSALVTSMNSGIICQPLDTTGLGLLIGYLDAVEITGELDLGVQVCFRETGTLIFLEKSTETPRLIELMTYRVSGMTCGWIDRPGTIVLVASSFPLSTDDSVNGGLRFRLQDCSLITTARLNFRVTPGGDESIEIIPENTTLVTGARSGGWFNVDYQGSSGWISADYVETRGAC